jgi:hypothetical protein
MLNEFDWAHVPSHGIRNTTTVRRCTSTLSDGGLTTISERRVVQLSAGRRCCAAQDDAAAKILERLRVSSVPARQKNSVVCSFSARMSEK